MLDSRGAERVHVETHVFPGLAVAVAFQRADLVERDTKVGAPKRFVLIELEAVLVIQMERPEFAKRHGKINFVGRIEPGQDGVRAFDEATHSLRVARELSDGERVADGRQISVVHRLVRLRLDGQADLFVVSQHFIERFDKQFDAAPSVLRLANVSALARKPENENVRAENSGDVNGAEGAVDRVWA